MEEHEVDKIVEVIRDGGGHNGSSFNGSVFKTLAAVGVLATLVFMARGEIKPLGERVNSVEARMQRIEHRTDDKLALLDKQLQTEITALSNQVLERIAAANAATKLQTVRTQARLMKIDEWIRWWQRLGFRQNTKRQAREMDDEHRQSM